MTSSCICCSRGSWYCHYCRLVSTGSNRLFHFCRDEYFPRRPNWPLLSRLLYRHGFPKDQITCKYTLSLPRTQYLVYFAAFQITWPRSQGYIGHPPKLILNSNLAKSRSFITSFSVVQLSWNFPQSTAVILPCSEQNFKTIGRFMNQLWAYEISRDLGLRWFSEILYCHNPLATDHRGKEPSG